jgi:zinc transport system ATP-binding protein
MSHALVTMHDVCVALGGKRILNGVNAVLARGQVAALIGLNGSGKTTLLRALVKEVPYTGTIRFQCGHDHSRPAPEHVGYVPQKLRLEANLPLTVLDLFAMTLRRRSLFFGVRRSLRREVEKLLETVGAAPLIDVPFDVLSGGQQQRVLVALAMQPQPELLLLDEPAAGIDFKDVEPFYDLIRDLNKRTGVTVLLVSHDLSMVSRLAHHVLCLQDGRIQCQGPPQEIVSGEVLTRTFGSDMAVYLHPHHHHPPSN